MKSLIHLLRTDISAQAALLVIFLLLAYPFIYGFPVGIIGYDTFGYYLYLPQLFIEGDLKLHDLDAPLHVIEVYKNSHVLYQVHPVEETGNHVIQYSSGMALVFLPFFLIGHLFAWLLDYQMDGYSLPYAWATIACGYFFTIVGILYLRKVLIKLFTPKIAALTLIIIIFGTNYFNIQTQSLGLTHIYLFAFYAALIYYTICWHEQQKLRYAIFIGIIIGWMVLIRPTEIFAVLIPLLWTVYNKENLRNKWQLITENWRSILAIFACATVFLVIQMLYWKHVTGSFIYYSYRNNAEGFDLDHPHLTEFLFSYRKGWFVYTPIALFALAGFFVKSANKKKWFLPLIVFTLITVYVSASWSVWWYAASFSQRTMVQSYPVIAVGLAAFLSWVVKKKLTMIPGLAVVGLLFFFNLFQSWQFMKGILPPDRITKDFYWAIFGKTSIPPETYELLSIERSTAVFDPEKYEPYWSRTLDETFNQQLGTLTLDEEDEFGKGIKIPFNETCNKDHCWYNIQFDALVTTGNDPDETQLICHLTRIDQPYGYTAFKLGQYPEFEFDKWVHYSYWWISPHPRIRKDRLITFLWGRKQNLLYRNFEVTSYVEKDK